MSEKKISEEDKIKELEKYYDECLKQVNDDIDKLKTKYGSLTFSILCSHTYSGQILSDHYDQLRILIHQQYYHIRDYLDGYKTEDIQDLLHVRSSNLFGERPMIELEIMKNILQKRKININGNVSVDIRRQCAYEFEQQLKKIEKEGKNIEKNNSEKKIIEGNIFIYKEHSIVNDVNEDYKANKKKKNHEKSLFSNQNINEKRKSNNQSVIVDVVNSNNNISQDSQNQESKINNSLLQIEKDNKKNNSILSSFTTWCGNKWDSAWNSVQGLFKDINFSCNCSQQQIQEERTNQINF